MFRARTSNLLWKITILFVMCCFSLSAQAKYGGGSGTANDPYLIYDANQMNAIGADSNDWDKHFLLCADIDLSAFTGTSFNIIGNSTTKFTGVFDGNAHIISNFTYDSNDTDYIGLFGVVYGKNAQIKDLGLIDPNIGAGTAWKVGSLLGSLRSGTITGCYIEGGSVSGTALIGGLVGLNEDGTITNCHSTGGVSGVDYVGGLVGVNRDTIGNCYSTSDVSGIGFQVGGLIGYNRGTVSNCCSTGGVSGGTRSSVGGLLGVNYGTVWNCYSTGHVTGTGWMVAGLVGENSGSVSNCYSTGDVSGDILVGGLVGWNLGTITNCYAMGNVLGDWYVGGLVGENYLLTITNCYATCDVSGDLYVGGLVGYNYQSVSNCFWDTDTQTHGVTESIGDNQGTVTNVIGLPTEQMQAKNTFTEAGWDFVGETLNGIEDMWFIPQQDYPHLWWELVPLLYDEPEITLGTSNTISWEPIIGDVEYYAECAEDPNFISIAHNSGWITKTSFEFAGLELGKRYWYSVKARNAAGVESQWSNVESSLQCSLSSAVETLLNPESLKNKNMKDALLNKIDEALDMIDECLYKEALNKLQNDILQKTDGCAESGQPDKSDWIIICEQQCVIYPLIIETIEYVKGLME